MANKKEMTQAQDIDMFQQSRKGKGQGAAVAPLLEISSAAKKYNQESEVRATSEKNKKKNKPILLDLEVVTTNSKTKMVQARIELRAKKIGNKASNLEELQGLSATLPSGLNVRVPASQALEHDFILAHLNRSAPEWRVEWEKFKKIQGSNKAELSKEALAVLSKIQAHIFKAFSVDKLNLNSNLKSYLEKMAASNSSLMVRSTGEEDTVDVANPGGNESVAAVNADLASVSQAIGLVVASYFSEKSLKQRLLSPVNDITKDPFMPVLLQAMIGEPVGGLGRAQDVVRSGVMYTGEAGTKIQLAPGHGELIVNSKAPFDTFVISREKTVYPEIYRKPWRLVPIEEQENGRKKRRLVAQANPKELQEQPSVSPAVAGRIAEIGRAIEKHYGMQMDVEFVYEPKNDEIFLVQARPIPKGDLKSVLASSIPPDRIPSLKKEAESGLINILPSPVISSAGNRAQVITNKEEILIARNIETALTLYLGQKNSKVKAVIVQELAPATSHEAAQFNSKAIPVFQVNEPAKVQAWMAKAKPVLIADPQRNQLIDWSKKIVNHKKAQQELYDKKKGILEVGLFTLPVTALTALPVGEAAKTPEELTRLVQLNNEVVKIYQTVINEKGVFKQLLSGFETLEAAKPGEPNAKALEALEQIQTIFSKIATSTEAKKGDGTHKKIFPYVLFTVAEIKSCLESYSRMNVGSLEANNKREELLTLASKLKSLAIYPGNPQVFSDSLRQLAQENKATLAIRVPSADKLNSEQDSYFKQFMKLEKIALNPRLKKQWAEFSLHCCQNKKDAQILSHLIKFHLKNKLESDWININFAKQLEKLKASTALANKTERQQALLSRALLLTLEQESEKIAEQLNNLQLARVKDTIHAWEQRLSEWGDPNKFDSLWKEYQKEIVPLINQLQIDPANTHPSTQKAVLKTVQDLTEVMDKTIKAMKGSPEYADSQRGLQAERFALLLEPYHSLMQKWMSAIPARQYKAWSPKVMSFYARSRDQMQEEISSTFKSLKNKPTAKQLNSSGNFSVASARADSPAAFYYQFSQKSDTLTLEDLFTLMHQNILACTAHLGKNSAIPTESLPKELQPLLAELESPTYTTGEYRYQLMNVSHDFPIVSLEYNFPLMNHSAKFNVEFNQLDGKTTLRGFMFGLNSGGRMDSIAELVKLEGVLVGAKVKLEPSYSERSSSMEFAWEFAADKLPKIAPKFAKAFFEYGLMTFDSSVNFSRLKERYPRLAKKGVFVSEDLQTIATKFKEVINARDKLEVEAKDSGGSLTEKFEYFSKLTALNLKLVSNPLALKAHAGSELDDLNKQLVFAKENRRKGILYGLYYLVFKPKDEVELAKKIEKKKVYLSLLSQIEGLDSQQAEPHLKERNLIFGKMANHLQTNFQRMLELYDYNKLTLSELKKAIAKLEALDLAKLDTAGLKWKRTATYQNIRRLPLFKGLSFEDENDSHLLRMIPASGASQLPQSSSSTQRITISLENANLVEPPAPTASVRTPMFSVTRPIFRGANASTSAPVIAVNSDDKSKAFIKTLRELGLLSAEESYNARRELRLPLDIKAGEVFLVKQRDGGFSLGVSKETAAGIRRCLNECGIKEVNLDKSPNKFWITANDYAKLKNLAESKAQNQPQNKDFRP